MMSNISKINIYVNSINTKSDETPSNFSVIIPDGLLKVNNKEEFELIARYHPILLFYRQA